MTFGELRKAYPWILKTYFQVANIPFDDFDSDIIGKAYTMTYIKQGSRWMLTDTRREDLTPRRYYNIVDAVPFFRGLGGYERVECSYSQWGRVPTRIVSISPDKATKVVREFIL